MIGASFHLFARKICKTDVFWATIFSLFYSMSAFPVLYGTVYIFWLDVLYIIPISAIAVNKALYEKKSSLLTIVFSYIFITQFYMGYLTGIFGFLYYFILLFTNHDKFKKKEIIHSVIRFAISAVNAILIAGFVWIPVLVFLLKYNPSDRTAFSDPQIGLLEVVNNLFWGEVQTAGWAPYIYCGIPCLLLLMLFFLNRKILIRDKIEYGVFLLFFVLGCFLIPLYRLLHGFDAPDSYNYRFSFIISFIVCAIACKQIAYISDIKKKYLCIWVVFLMAIYLLEGRLERFEIGDASSNTGSKLIVNLVMMIDTKSNDSYDDDLGFDVDELVRKIDAKIAELEEEEKRQNELNEKNEDNKPQELNNTTTKEDSKEVVVDNPPINSINNIYDNSDKDLDKTKKVPVPNINLDDGDDDDDFFDDFFDN